MKFAPGAMIFRTCEAPARPSTGQCLDAAKQTFKLDHQGESSDQNGDANNTSKNHSPAGDCLERMKAEG